MEAEASPAVAVRDVGCISGSEPKPLTIKTSSPASESISASVSSSMPITPHLNSPSPPSSAFVSALQSPYISPRAVEPPKRSETPSSITASPSPISFSGDEIPSTSCTTSERYDLSSSEPRISFSFSPCANAKLRSCDVYIGFHGQTLHLPRFCKWLRSELELQGIASFAADRSKISDSQSRQIADRIIRSATYGIVAVTAPSFLTPLAVEEIRFFAQKKNLIPLLFGTEISGMSGCGDTLERLARSSELRLEANDCNWRSCVTKAVTALQIKLARKSAAAEKERGCSEELPLPRNSFFVGREKEMSEIEAAFFGRSPEVECIDGGGSSDECNGGYICLEMRKCQEPALEAWIEPRMETGSKERSRQRSKSRSVVCISGVSGIGKTELALEFAYRHSQRYKMVLWVGGEARHLRQNVLNLSMSLGLDVSAEAERERGICRNFDEQECDAFQRVRRDLFRDVPFLLVIDNLETEKDLQDLIPRNTGASHVIITTRLSKAMNSDPIALPPLSLSDSLVLIRGRRRREDFPAEELEVLRNMGERLGRLSFGLWLIGSLLSELAILPSALLEAIERMPLGQISVSHDECLPNNPFLLKTLAFSFAILERADGRRSSALGIIFAGAWLAPAPVSSELLAAAVAEKRKALSSSLCFRLSSQSSKSGAESAALMIVKLGLARISTMQPGCHIQFHAITRLFSRIRGGTSPAKSSVLGVRKSGITASNSSHLWASAFLLFGFKSEPPVVRLDVFDTVLFIKKIAIPLAIQSFTAFSSCNSALELLKVSTDVLEEVEKSFVLRNEEWSRRSLCWKKRLKGDQRVDEYVWQEVTLLKASLLETRAKLLLRGGLFDTGEELCRTCISIRTVMLGHNHAQTLAAQETLAKLVRYRSKI